jgi:hypothetical protein
MSLKAILLITQEAAKAREAIKKPSKTFPLTDFKKDGSRRDGITSVKLV